MKLPATKIILTRHTLSEWNAIGRIQGQTDTDLHARGIVEAKELAKNLSDLSIHSIISSDLRRAKSTAEIINDTLSVPLQLDRRLRECSFGQIEGLTPQQALAKYGREIVPHLEDRHQSYDFRPFGGEHRAAVLARHIDVLRSLTNEQPNGAILLVGHGRGLCTLLAGLGLPPILKQCEYQVIEYR